RRERYQQAAGGLRVPGHLGELGRNIGRHLDLVGEPLAVPSTSTAEMSLRCQTPCPGQQREALGGEHEPDVASVRHLVAVTEAAEARDIGARVDGKGEEAACRRR